MSSDREIARFYQSADLAVSVASSDGKPISVQEAMACGTPLILGDIPAFHNWVTNEKEALLIPVNDANALANAIIRLLSERELQAILVKNALKYIQHHADSNIWMQASKHLYQQLVAAKQESGS